MGERFTKSYYKIGEVAELIGVPLSTLRYWETEFSDLVPKRTAHNRRLYTPQNLELLQIIKYLLHDRGLKIDAAKEYLKSNQSNLSRKFEIIDKLREVRDELSSLQAALSMRIQKGMQ